MSELLPGLQPKDNFSRCFINFLKEQDKALHSVVRATVINSETCRHPLVNSGSVTKGKKKTPNIRKKKTKTNNPV